MSKPLKAKGVVIFLAVGVALLVGLFFFFINLDSSDPGESFVKSALQSDSNAWLSGTFLNDESNQPYLEQSRDIIQNKGYNGAPNTIAKKFSNTNTYVVEVCKGSSDDCIYVISFAQGTKKKKTFSFSILESKQEALQTVQ